MNQDDLDIDELYRRIDNKLLSGDFLGIDNEIALIDVEHTSTIMLIGWLSITLAAKEKLTKRNLFVNSVRQKLEKTDPKRVDALLSGLE